jgi:hypothetical protein
MTRNAAVDWSGGLRLFGCALVLSAALCTAGCWLFIAGAAGGGAGVAASVDQGEEEHHGTATYVATVLLDVFYVPAKVVFAGLGAATSGLAYILTAGDTDATRSVWDASVKGTYVLTPRMIEGRDPVHFVGPG